ncbi:3-deoxy-manno-octulosonate cytidylyltransferase [Oligella sp. HMSC09E12]|uniref:3-deoxy-manno-octulosonate cytidylyltransferase n=1 Tax=Oligella sp. HMSC09E12 TaxID=1581147 RepID=UPI0008A43688|nr:3-deoxy-manno-octulosonate cytidylyltransferase [Oligella sp. HMSC09E12]OFV50983.1 3-deoxy-manno-octulosonate cytidylyltransferase [Oligella sp. HMSC09E12]
MSLAKQQPDFIAVVPARAASSRLPGKMLVDIAGTPMVVHTVRRAEASAAKAVYVATDDEAIFEVVTAHGFQALMTSAAHPSGTDRLAEVVQQLKLSSDTIVVNVQGDEPLIEPRLINQVATTLAASPAAAIATAAYPIQQLEKLFNPNVVKVVLTQTAEALYFSRAPIPWARDSFNTEPKRLPEQMQAYHHIGLYAYRAHFLSAFPSLSQGPLEQLESLEQLRALEHGYKIQVMLTDSAPAPGVDSAEDLEIVRKFF